MGGVFELIARAAIVAAVAGSFGYVGVCLADPAAWLAALVPIVPYYFYKIFQDFPERNARWQNHGGCDMINTIVTVLTCTVIKK